MEYIEFLVSGNADDECSIEKLKTIILDKNIQVTKSSNKTLFDYLYEDVNEDDCPELFEIVESEFQFYSGKHNYNVSVKRFTKNGSRFLRCRIETDENTNIHDICNSEWLAFRTMIVEKWINVNKVDRKK